MIVLPDISNEGEKEVHQPKPVYLCNHKDYLKGEYIDNKDGTFSCKHCGWGGPLPVNTRVIDGKLVSMISDNVNQAD